MSFHAPSKHGDNEIFQALKPVAVDLSQAMLSLQTSRFDVKLIEQSLQTLQSRITSIVQKGGDLDAKLADYLFFPVSQVLKSSQKVSLHCLELTLSIVVDLVRYGWRDAIQPQLAQQLLILCTLLAGDKPQLAQGQQTTTDLRRNALSCMHQTLLASGHSVSGVSTITIDANIPQLGQSVTVVLDALQQQQHPEIQIAAIAALAALINLNLGTNLLLSFLPGVVSSLVKVLTLKSSQRRRPEVLVSSLEILANLLRTLCNDADSKGVEAEEALSAAIPQIKLALNQTVRLRTYERIDVRTALGHLCMSLLRYCRKTLESCVEMLLETILTLSADASAQALHFELVMLMTTDATMLTAVQSTLYVWAQSTARIMQGADDEIKRHRLSQIRSAYSCLVDAGADLTTTSQLLLRTLKDCVLLTLSSTKLSEKIVAEVNTLQLARIVDDSAADKTFTSIVSSSGQRQIMGTMQELVQDISKVDLSKAIASELVSTLHMSREDGLVANFWLLLRYLHHATQTSLELDSMLDLDSSLPVDQIDEVYSFALSCLNTEDCSSAVTSLSLQGLALKAQTTGAEFKFELVDALYPVLHALATPHDTVQHDSMVTLNILTKVCGYDSVKDLIIDNVDYLTNAVALKLNAFDVSPQAPQVLLMMVRLAGPSLVPHLEDTLESIFAALEDYHGYPLLVELLFKALAVIADEGVKAPLLAGSRDQKLLLDNATSDHWQPAEIQDLATLIKERSLVTPREAVNEPTPHEPWGPGERPEDVDAAPPVEDIELPPPAPKTYNTLVKITELTQHFLPSASPALRMSLLGLIYTTVPAIARHENTFLPLINTLWPEIVSRLDDEEASIRAATLDIVAILCDYAKDFMRSRIGELWPHLKSLWAAVLREIDANAHKTQTQQLQLPQQTIQALRRMQAGPEDYSNTGQRALWQALMRLLVSIIRSVPTTPQTFDEALHMMRTELERAEVLDAFEKENADAVWLLRLRQHEVQVAWQPPSDHGFVSTSLPVCSEVETLL